MALAGDFSHTSMIDRRCLYMDKVMLTEQIGYRKLAEMDK
jgi:hypothetical protein